MGSIENILAKIDPARQTDRELVSKAFEFAKKHHEGQLRAGGEPYIVHPVAVAQTLADLKLDSATVAAGLLHDTVEDTPATEKDIEKNFGKEVAFLVRAVTKLSQIQYKNRPESDAEAKKKIYAQNLRKMFFAMAEDIRVILIKLADRFHNMNTIVSKAPEDRKRVSLETLEIYGPIAERLGMGQMKGELEDMAFPYAYPEEYQWLKKTIKEKYSSRQKYLEKIRPLLIKKLESQNIKIVDAHSRAKHYFSLYKKLLKNDCDVNRVYDLVALRIILPDIASCYGALGVIHKNYKPVPKLIKDYVALPKLNGYQSIHTTIFDDKGKFLEIQLRTPQMHEHAENGIAAHWSYGETNKNKLHTADIKEAQWVASLKNWMKQSNNKKFYQSLRTDFFSDRVFVLTPLGEIKDLPEGSTPLDFAYAIHTDIGHSAKGARVNGKLVPLDYKLKTGEVVEIIKSKKQRPSRDWLKIVKSSEAKKKIQSWLKSMNAISAPPPDKEQSQRAKPIFGSQSQTTTVSAHSVNKFSITGQKNLLSKVAQCCSPLPGNEIIGHITKQGGISVHRLECSNLRKFNTAKLVSASWPEKADYYPLKISLAVNDKIGMLQEIGKVMKDLKINVLEIKNTPATNGVGKVNMVLAMKDREQSDKLFRKLNKNKNIIAVKQN